MCQDKKDLFGFRDGGGEGTGERKGRLCINNNALHIHMKCCCIFTFVHFYFGLCKSQLLLAADSCIVRLHRIVQY